MSTMKINYKEIFEFFRLALVTCIMEKEELIKWADDELLFRDDVNNDIIELSLSGKLPYSQLIGLLNTFQGIPDHQLPIKLLFAYVISKCSADKEQIQSLISGLQMVKAEAHVEKKTVKEINELENDLAFYQKSELTLDELHEKLESFLNQYIEYQGVVKSIMSHTVDLQ
jgi:hypothetical protein